MPEAISLMDTAPKTENVPFNGNYLVVQALSGDTILELMKTYPPLQGLAVGRKLDAAIIMDMGSQIISALVAASLGFPGDRAAEEKAKALPIETQLDVISAMGRCTFTQGFGPFAIRLKGMFAAVYEEATKVQATRSQETSPLSAVPPIQQSGS